MMFLPPRCCRRSRRARRGRPGTPGAASCSQQLLPLLLLPSAAAQRPALGGAGAVLLSFFFQKRGAQSERGSSKEKEKKNRPSIVALFLFFSLSLPIPTHLRPLPARGSCCCSLLLRLASRLSGGGSRTRRWRFPCRSSAVAGHLETRSSVFFFFSESRGAFTPGAFTPENSTESHTVRTRALVLFLSLARSRLRASPVLISESAHTHERKRCARWRTDRQERERENGFRCVRRRKKKSDRLDQPTKKITRRHAVVVLSFRSQIEREQSIVQ